MFDILIKNGTIVDGSGNPRYKANVAIKDGKIVKIATNLNDEAENIIDAKGLIVSPGFIDSHTHSDSVILLGTDAYNHLEQGTTTEIAGQCGSSPVPYYDGLSLGKLPKEKLDELITICDNYKSFMDYTSKLELGTNIALFAGHGAIRGKVMGFAPGKPTVEQLEQEKILVAQAMESGYLGITTGFVYAPSVYADEEETIELCKIVAKYNGVYSSHIRDEADGVVEAVGELINVVKRTGVTGVVSHLKVSGSNNEGLSTKLLAMLEEADVYADQYPYTAGSAPFISTIPPEFHVNGPKVLLENLKSPEFRNKVIEVIRNSSASSYNLTDFNGFLIVDCQNTKHYIGKTLQQIADAESKAPFDVAFDLLIDNDGTVQMVYFTQNLSDMETILSHPRVMAGSDWSDYTKHFDTEQIGGGHPRAISTMVRHLELVRDLGLFTLEDAVERITSLPADIYQLEDIGLLQEGYNADITIFDYSGLKSNCDFIHPFRKNDGIKYVIVNGKLAVKEGIATGIKAGHVIKKSR